MKILNVNALLDPVTGGGTAERTLQISRALMDEGADCRILTTDIGFVNGSLPRLYGLNVTAYQCLLKRFYIPRVSLASIKKEVEGVDVIHIMGHWSVLNALVYLAARLLQKLYVVCPAGALPIYGRSKILKTIYNWIIGRRIIRDASAWIAITEDERSQFEVYGIDRKSVIIIPNGINPGDFSETDVQGFRKKHGLVNHPFILFLGRLNSIKGPDLLLEAFCRGQEAWPEWHLVFAGPDGGLLDSLKKSSAASAVHSRVHFVGYVGGEEKSSAYRSAQLLVIPSRQEAMSIVVLEAGISGTPVLITDQCGFNDVAIVNGGIVVSASVESIQKGLIEILKDAEKLRSMGRNLKKYVEDNFTWKIAVERYLQLYRKILERG
jgi:glycosyltransferase involved in cell wall biosynthesis